MYNTRYYPLIDCNSEGREKVPMFFSVSEESVRNHHDAYLEEVIPKHYRLCSAGGIAPPAAKAYTIHCPMCGRTLKCVAAPGDNHRLGLYVCPDCNH